jgi:hypothetical protein
MKKLFAVSLVVVASLCFVGLTFAQTCGMPPICDEIFVTKSDKFKGKWITPELGPYKGPKCVKPPCGPCFTCPSTPYARGPILKNIDITKKVSVYRDWCKGEAKGCCPIGCGPCAPMVFWSGKWKTAEKIGEACAKYTLPPAYRWDKEDAVVVGDMGVVGMPKPIIVDCF